MDIKRGITWVCIWLGGFIFICAGCSDSYLLGPSGLSGKGDFSYALKRRIQSPEKLSPLEGGSHKKEEVAVYPSEEPAIDLTGEKLTLEKAIDLALRINPKLKMMEEELGIASQNVSVAFSAFLPHIVGVYGFDYRDRQVYAGINGSVFPTAEKTFQRAELTIQMTIWDFGKSLAGYLQAKIARKIAELSLERARQTVIYQVSKSYYDLLKAKKMVVVADQAIKQAGAHLEVVKSLYENGLVDRSDLLRAEVQLSEARQSYISAKNALKLAISAFNSAIGINVNMPVDVVEKTGQIEFNSTLAYLLELAVENRAEFPMVQKMVDAEIEGYRASVGNLMPRIYVSASAKRVDDDYQVYKNSGIAEIGIEMDLFAGGRKYAEVKIAEHRIRRAIEQAKRVCDNIAFEVKQAYCAILDAKARMELAEKTLKQVDENLRLVESRYKQGAASSTDVIDAQTLRTRAYQSYYVAFYEYLSAIEQLRYAIGVNDKADLKGMFGGNLPSRQGTDRGAVEKINSKDNKGSEDNARR